MVCRTRYLQAEAHHSNHAQRVEGMAGREGARTREYADVEVSEDQREQGVE